MVKAVLLDDEQRNVDNLAYILQHDCERVHILLQTVQVSEARNFILENEIDVLFLDIEMPEQNGFDFLKSLGKYLFKVVFVTAYDHYSLRAIKAGALDYILKPVNIEEVQQVIHRIRIMRTEQHFSGINQELLLDFLRTTPTKTSPKRIALPQLGSVTYVDIDHIIALEAQSNYTVIHKPNRQTQTVSKTLKDFEEILDDLIFVRIHKSYIINLNHVKETHTNEGFFVVMDDGLEWSISRRQMEHFLQKMNRDSITFRKNQ